MQMRLVLVGDYPYPMTEEIKAALQESCVQHAKAYGFVNIAVGIDYSQPNNLLRNGANPASECAKCGHLAPSHSSGLCSVVTYSGGRGQRCACSEFVATAKCATCDGTGLVSWQVGSTGNVPCPDCGGGK